MQLSRRSFLAASSAAVAAAAAHPRLLLSQEAALTIETPMEAPVWALLEREVLAAHTAACEQFFNRYFDEKGYLLCYPRWGADDGPDDAEFAAAWAALAVSVPW